MEKINQLKSKFKNYNLDGYLIPKNDEYLNEYVPDHKDDLKYITNFSGSYGFALILKKKIIAQEATYIRNLLVCSLFK